MQDILLDRSQTLKRRSTHHLSFLDSLKEKTDVICGTTGVCWLVSLILGLVPWEWLVLVQKFLKRSVFLNHISRFWAMYSTSLHDTPWYPLSIFGGAQYCTSGSTSEIVTLWHAGSTVILAAQLPLCEFCATWRIRSDVSDFFQNRPLNWKHKIVCR